LSVETFHSLKTVKVLRPSLMHRHPPPHIIEGSFRHSLLPPYSAADFDDRTHYYFFIASPHKRAPRRLIRSYAAALRAVNGRNIDTMALSSHRSLFSPFAVHTRPPL